MVRRLHRPGIADLLAGSAGSHWYYGAFQRHRQADVPATIRAVLGDGGVEAPRILEWLSRHGHLNELLRQLGTREVRRLLLAEGVEPASNSDPGAGSGDTTLAAAAIQLLEQILRVPGPRWTAHALAVTFLQAGTPPANWGNRRTLSARVLELVRFVLARAEPHAIKPEPVNIESVRELLEGPLDWLDGPWLSEQLTQLAQDTQSTIATPARAAAPRRPLLTPRHDRILEALARQLREGRIGIESGDDEETLAVRLLAAATVTAGSDAPLDRALVAAVEDIARASCASQPAPRPSHSPVDRPHDADERLSLQRQQSATPRSEPPSDVGALSRHGRSALELFRAIAATKTAPLAESGETTPAAGLYLLSRAVLDLRIPALARQSSVALPALLGALAVKWLNLEIPLDASATPWTGTDRPDVGELEAAVDHVRALNESLFELLIARRMLEADSAREVIARDAVLIPGKLECSACLDAHLSTTASLLLRAWGHWLPGIGSSSGRFLLDNCVRRSGRVLLSEERIAVELEPAPLDVVLGMAGYLAPIERVAWLDDRTVTFSVRRVAER